MFLAKPSFAIQVNFNQAWFKTNYGLQYFDQFYDEVEVNRIFKLTQEAGSKSLRLWFFESPTLPMFKWEKGKIAGYRNGYIKNVIKTLQIAKNHDIQVYMTLLDGHVYNPLKMKDENQARLEHIYQLEGGQEFLINAVGPLLNAIDQAGLASVINRIDLSNEIDTVINRLGFDHGWKGASRMLCQWKSFIQRIHSFEKTPVSFSLRLHALIALPWDLFKDDGPMACADYFDFHSYENSGDVFSCHRLKKYSALNKKEIILGEFGQSYFTHRYSDELQIKNTKNYLHSANSCGFKEAYAWRLSDIRNGYNPEARYSFESYGMTRPAYDLIKAENASN